MVPPTWRRYVTTELVGAILQVIVIGVIAGRMLRVRRFGIRALRNLDQRIAILASASGLRTRGPASRIRTLTPAFASRVATRLPATPDPTMTTSADQGMAQAIERGGFAHAPNGAAQVPGAGISSALHTNAPV